MKAGGVDLDAKRPQHVLDVVVGGGLFGELVERRLADLVLQVVSDLRGTRASSR